MNRKFNWLRRVLLTSMMVLLTWLVMPTTSFVYGADPGTKDQAFRRFIFVVGANNGGASRVRLKFATTDAAAMAKLMQELGGVAPNDAYVLTDPSRNGLETGFRQLQSILREAKRAGQRVEVIVYYSGHSDEQGLLLNGEHFSYAEMRKAIDALPADVRVAVLDSCASGALTREKGGTRRSAFLVDASTEVRGHAFLTSSSADESAQESDKIGGSFFTHYLISGLRGAADENRDGRVNINEAYYYAFHETLARTESTRAGPQHPSYDFQLAGAGDLVITDLSEVSALLELPAEMSGRFFIRDAGEHLVAEVNKRPGQPMSIGLEPGEYRLTVQQKDSWLKGAARLEKGKKTILSLNNFQRTTAEGTVARGPEHSEAEIIHRPVNFSFLPGLNTNFGIEKPIKNNFSINLIVDWSDYLDGVELSTVGNIRLYDVRGFMGSAGFNYVGGNQVGVQSSLLNINIGNVKGVQASLGNYSGSLQGTQAGLLNINLGNVKGIQASLGNYTSSVQGAQLAEINIATGNVLGLQGSLVNYAGAIRGAQLGLVNVAVETTGAEVGLVNFSKRIDGAQVGLINVAVENNGEAIGLINYAGNGMLAPTIWTSDTGLVNAGIKMGAGHLYTLFGVGVQPLQHDGWYSAIFGLGGHVDFSPWWLDIDLLGQELFAFDDPLPDNGLDQLTMLRFMPGYRVNDSLSLYAGPTLNLMMSSVRENVGPDWSFRKFSHEMDSIDSEEKHPDSDKLHFKFYPGLVIGVQFEPQIGDLNRRAK